MSNNMKTNHIFQELDDRLMNKTLRDACYYRGAKFVLFGDVQFQRECLEAHNRIRKQYGCGDLTWSEHLAEKAQVWAAKIAEDGVNLFYEDPQVGQNISTFNIQNDLSEIPSSDDVVNFWANEAVKHNFIKQHWQADTQHFTQMVWRETTEMGVARALSKNGKKVVIVAFYSPAGNNNRPGQFAKNVPSLTYN